MMLTDPDVPFLEPHLALPSSLTAVCCPRPARSMLPEAPLRPYQTKVSVKRLRRCYSTYTQQAQPRQPELPIRRVAHLQHQPQYSISTIVSPATTLHPQTTRTADEPKRNERQNQVGLQKNGEKGRYLERRQSAPVFLETNKGNNGPVEVQPTSTPVTGGTEVLEMASFGPRQQKLLSSIKQQLAHDNKNQVQASDNKNQIGNRKKLKKRGSRQQQRRLKLSKLKEESFRTIIEKCESLNELPKVRRTETLSWGTGSSKSDRSEVVHDYSQFPSMQKLSTVRQFSGG